VTLSPEMQSEDPCFCDFCESCLASFSEYSLAASLKVSEPLGMSYHSLRSTAQQEPGECALLVNAQMVKLLQMCSATIIAICIASKAPMC
jgi:hypothetical protein